MSKIRRTFWAGALATTFILLGSTAFAQVATTLEQAELAGLTPEKRAEVESRLVGGNTVYGVLQTILLNNIKAKHEASKILALDFNRGRAVVETPHGKIKMVDFDTTTLVIKK